LEQRRRLLSTQWERQQKAREEKLKNIKAQVEDGSLVIRKMTDEERKANPPRPPRERKPPR
jgi:anti-sigma28 factor (negative regulator of flagellin synthesis)